MSDTTTPSPVITVGGPILAASASLRVFGATLDPDEVTRLLLRLPTSSYRVGDRVSPRVAAQRKKGMWVLDSSLPRTESLSDHVIQLFTQLPDDAAIWEGLRQKCTVDVFCGVDIRVPNSGTELTAAAIAALAVRGLSLQFDFYALGEEEGEAEDY